MEQPLALPGSANKHRESILGKLFKWEECKRLGRPWGKQCQALRYLDIIGGRVLSRRRLQAPEIQIETRQVVNGKRCFSTQVVECLDVWRAKLNRQKPVKASISQQDSAAGAKNKTLPLLTSFLQTDCRLVPRPVLFNWPNSWNVNPPLCAKRILLQRIFQLCLRVPDEALALLSTLGEAASATWFFPRREAR